MFNICKNFSTLYLRMFCVRFGWNWPCGLEMFKFRFFVTIHSEIHISPLTFRLLLRCSSWYEMGYGFHSSFSQYYIIYTSWQLLIKDSFYWAWAKAIKICTKFMIEKIFIKRSLHAMITAWLQHIMKCFILTCNLACPSVIYHTVGWL